MSYRELRSFSETMRLLGYPGLISMESFRTPNVELVADCLYWLIKRYEPSVEVAYNIERESDRVFFFKQVCEAALTKARIRLNIKKLYQCDGHAVQEMLKLAIVLKKAMKAATEGSEPDFAALQQMAAQKNVHEAKAVQQLCSDLTSDGSSLFFLVEAEVQTRGERQHVLSRATEVGEFERRLRDLLTSVSQQVSQLQQSITNLGADETNLEQKAESKKTQLERAQKRHRSLMAVRPAYVEEYDRHEAELQSQFVKYLEQYRNLEFLEHQLAKFNAKEDAALREQQVALSVMRERLRKEELKALRGGSAGGGGGGGKRNGAAAGTGGVRRGRVIHPDDDDDDDDDDDGDRKNSYRGGGGGGRGGVPAGLRVRNAAEEGSSVSSGGDDDDDDDDDDDPPRHHSGSGGGGGYVGRSGLSGSGELANRQQRALGGPSGFVGVSGGGVGGPVASPLVRPGAAAKRGSGHYGTIDDSGDDDDDSDTSTDATSDYSTSDDTSDMSTDDESDI